MKNIFLTLTFFSLNLYSHFPEKMKCMPQVIHFCSSSNVEIKEGKSQCRSLEIQEKTNPFYLEPKKLGKNNIYSFNTDWFNPGKFVKETIMMMDIDQQEMPSQMKERFFYARKIRGEDGIIDNDISGFATISGTGHPHTFQFIFAEQSITQTNVAFCEESN